MGTTVILSVLLAAAVIAASRLYAVNRKLQRQCDTLADRLSAARYSERLADADLKRAELTIDALKKKIASAKPDTADKKTRKRARKAKKTDSDD